MRSVAALIAVALTAAATTPATVTERARAFADCAGRYAAEADHSIDPEQRAAARARATLFGDLLAAVAPDVPDVSPLRPRSWSIEAKMAHADLLTGRPDARAIADRLLAPCAKLVLPA